MAAMVVALAARRESVQVRAGAFRLLARVHSMVIGLGAVLALGTGVLLTMGMVSSGTGDTMAHPRIWLMQGAGVLGALLVLFVGLPTAVKLSGLAVPGPSGELLPAFERYRKRQAIVSSVAGVLAIVALYASLAL